MKYSKIEKLPEQEYRIYRFEFVGITEKYMSKKPVTAGFFNGLEAKKMPEIFASITRCFILNMKKGLQDHPNYANM